MVGDDKRRRLRGSEILLHCPLVTFFGKYHLANAAPDSMFLVTPKIKTKGIKSFSTYPQGFRNKENSHSLCVVFGD